VVQSYEYSAYGESLSGKDAVNAFRFVGGAGGYTDDATGLVQFWNRWYDPSVGKWVSEDPIRQAGGVNLYGYVGNSPLAGVDVNGLAWIRQPNEEYFVGRDGFERIGLEPGGLVSRSIENYVPAGHTFGVMHDQFVGDLQSLGIPDILINVPTMGFVYNAAVWTEMYNSLQNLLKKVKVPEGGGGKNPPQKPPC
jgi:RHS repeat-associated protein